MYQSSTMPKHCMCLRQLVYVVGLLWLLSPCAYAAAPVVDAGPDVYVAQPATELTLFGQASDPDGDPLEVGWSVVSGPGAVVFSAPWATITSAAFSVEGTYTLQLSAGDGTAVSQDTVTATYKPESSQTAFYVDPTYTGSTQDGSAEAPWKQFHDGNSLSSAQWSAINAALLDGDVIVYFSARQAASDTAEQLSGSVRVRRPPRGQDMSSFRLTLDGMSRYNTNDATPSWAPYTGSQRFKILKSGGCCFSIGWDDDLKRDHVTLRGFDVSGSGARVFWGGSDSVLEHMAVHDVSGVGATVIFATAVSEFPACEDMGKAQYITVRKNTVARGVGEGIYIAGNYTKEEWGGCLAYGNTHTDLLIEGNTVTDPGVNGGEGDGIDLKAGLQRVTVRNNVVTHAEVHGIVSLGVFLPARTDYLIEGNRLVGGGEDAMLLGNQHGVVIQNNIADDNGGGLYLIGEPGGEVFDAELYHNTVHGHGIQLADSHGVRIRNNLLFGLSGAAIHGWDSDGIDSDYNLFAPNDSEFAEGPHTIVRASSDGLVVDRANGDFHLVTGSPALDAGEDLSSYSVVADYEGDERPQANGYDIGADESGDVGEPPPPPPPEDAEDPQVQITSPADGATIAKGKTLAVQVAASDNVGVTEVRVAYKRTSSSSYTGICTDTSSPYSCNWRVPNQRNRSYHLRARAVDAAGNMAEHVITVRVP